VRAVGGGGLVRHRRRPRDQPLQHLRDHLVLSRTLVYGGLTASLLALYLAVVLGVGVVFGTSPRFWVPLAATAAVALLLLPIRDALRAAVSRRLYGGRDAAAFEVLA